MLDEQRGSEKRECQAERIHCEIQHARFCVGVGGTERQYGSEYRADAGRPADGKGDAQQKGHRQGNVVVARTDIWLKAVLIIALTVTLLLGVFAQVFVGPFA